MFNDSKFEPSRIGFHAQLGTYMEWDRWLTGKECEAASLLNTEKIISCLKVEITIKNQVAEITPEIQKPKPSMFGVDQNNEEVEDQTDEVRSFTMDFDEDQIPSQVPLQQGSYQIPAPELIADQLAEQDVILEPVRTETPDEFHVQNTQQYNSVQCDSPRRIDPSFQSSTQLQGHENPTLFNSQSTIGNGSKSTLESGEPEPKFQEGDKYDYLFHNMKKWDRMSKFPLAFTAMVQNDEVVIDKMSYPKKTPELAFIPRKDLVTVDDAIQLKNPSTKNERQIKAAKENQKTTKKHARKKQQRDDTFQLDEENYDYIITDIPKSREKLIYTEKFLGGPLKLLLDHHKTLGTLPTDPEELEAYTDKHIWPALKATYRYGEIMKRRKNSNEEAWESSCKRKNLSH